MPKPKSKRPTIRDVAREAGVSYGTVSRVLNSHPDVATDTRLHVQRVMEKMKGESRKSRVTVYYLLAEDTGTLDKLA